MTCRSCQVEAKKFGRHPNGLQRFRCRQCLHTFTEPHQTPLDDMRTPMDKALLILRMLVEGSSIRSVERITSVHRDTICKLVVLAGQRCERLLEEKLRDLDVADIQCDEIWGFVRKKESHKRPEEAHDNEIGDQWCFVAIERNTKLIVAWHLGRRLPGSGYLLDSGSTPGTPTSCGLLTAQPGPP